MIDHASNQKLKRKYVFFAHSIRMLLPKISEIVYHLTILSQI